LGLFKKVLPLQKHRLKGQGLLFILGRVLCFATDLSTGKIKDFRHRLEMVGKRR